MVLPNQSSTARSRRSHSLSSSSPSPTLSLFISYTRASRPSISVVLPPSDRRRVKQRENSGRVCTGYKRSSRAESNKPSRAVSREPSRLPSQVDFPSQSLEPPSYLSRVHSCRVPVSLGVGEVTLEFRNFRASAVEANSPLLGWIRLDADLNEILATSQYGLRVNRLLYLWGSVPYRHGILRDHETDMCILRDTRLICEGMARGRPARDKKDA
ncbi:hypothetical protein E5676_scaffold208G00650 [Cucumis melo var. makuwa]|uniref:Ty3-gypsy retrotransposon protein n=1 Tax=Cucumis melo var. makuwa TaxID=1194695 RepID=A0A5D3E170_CUCMM|nr:hypothetical protein E5676_scaffold208G00650 [Cucumis melo var. makuwa]